MGDCKSEMKETKAKEVKVEKKGIFSKIRKDKENIETVAETFVDHVNVATEKLETLITMKNKELDTENGREDYNRRALGRLESMAWHMDKVADLAIEYGEDN